MFSGMISELEQGRLPRLSEVATRLRAGLVKKMAILRQPAPFWPGDPKINPPSAHLLWAAVVVNDKESFDLAMELLVFEKMEAGRGAAAAISGRRDELVAAARDELLMRCGSASLKATLADTMQRLAMQGG